MIQAAFASLLPFIPYILMVLMFGFIMYQAHKSSESKFNVYDYLIDPNTGKASISRTLQMTAGATATWTIIKQASMNSLTVEMFGVYLCAMGLAEGYSKYIAYKSQSAQSSPTNQ
jgi:hypothetical protein